LLVLGGSGCVVPFVSPPLRVTQAFGLAGGDLQAEHAPRRERVGRVEPVSVTRVGVHPLQLGRALRDRRFDVGLGYSFETFTAEQLLGKYDKHGLYGELTVFPFRTMFDGRVGSRFGTTLTADLLFSDAGYGVEVGGGASLALTLEIFGFAGGSFAGGDLEPDDGVVAVGGVFGEWSVAMSAYGACRALDGASYGQLGVAVSVRLPASAGVLMFWPRGSGHSSRHGDGPEYGQGNDDDSSSSSADEYHADEGTPSDGGISAGSGDDDDDDDHERGTVEVTPPPRGTVEVTPP
jgi:hypothetical protein